MSKSARDTIAAETNAALNKLCKWRTVLAGWHAGTKTIDEGGAKAMRDLMDKWLIIRTESNALVALLINKGVFTAEDFTAQVGIEASLLDKSLEQVFKGFRTIPAGIEIYDAKVAAETTHKLGFPP